MSARGLLRRAGRRTNLALLLVFAGAFLTGWLSFAAGTPTPARLTTLAHGLCGLGVVVLMPWKSAVITRASVIRSSSLVLVGLVLICLLAGFIEVFVGFGELAGLSPIQVHVGAAVLAVPLLVWHAVRHRRGQRPRRRDLSRRALLRTGLFAVGIGATYALLEGVGRWTGGPASRRLSTGSHRLDPDAIPATIWLLDPVPALDVTHRLIIAGRSFGVEELEAAAGPPLVARLDCTSGWYADASWTGASLAQLLPSEALAAAASIQVSSVTGYTRRFPAAEAAELWLATRCQGRPLSQGSGSPVRLVAPNRRGFWWVKWVATVELSDQPAWQQSPFPLT